MKSIMIGIDLGTTNSEVALIENGKAHIIEIEKDSGSYQLPSYVGLDEQGDILSKRWKRFILL